MQKAPIEQRSLTPIKLGSWSTLPNSFYAYDMRREALLVSVEHRRHRGKWTSGGPFYVWKRFQTPGKFEGLQMRGSAGDWKGPLVPLQTSLLSPPPVPTIPSWASQVAALTPLGAKGWKRARPGNPEVDSLVTLIEAARDLPSLPLRLFHRLSTMKSLGSEYLNVVYGWIPLLSDIRKMYETYRDLDEKLQQLIRDNGKGIRRRRSLGDSTTVTMQASGTQPGGLRYMYPTVTGGGIDLGSSSYVTYTKTRTKTWFAGRFRYYVPDIGSDRWTRNATRVLFGINPTPSALWEALPWSWLIDWFANVGDVMSNLSANAVDNLVADYAYVMQTVETEIITTVTGQWPAYTNLPLGRYTVAGVHSTSSRDLTVTKTRIAANPYGFGITYNGLSAYQMSILAALGMTRQSRF